ncbi:MAG: SoxR reducing system RseC family protein [Spirochaetaceae bacterium]|jgi:hypothetical protein|nr:SoxR reducing system RseC family protein [Spirochaetaceae bacterium]
MRENGRIISLKDNIAVVKVERDAASGSCCHFDTKESVMLKARNLCEAAIDDNVILESDNPPSKKLFKIGAGLGGFIAGLFLGDYGAARLGLAGGFGSDALSFLLAAALAGLAFFTIAALEKRGGRDLPVVCEVLP